MILLISISVFLTLIVLILWGYQIATAEKRAVSQRLVQVAATPGTAAESEQLQVQSGGLRGFLRSMGRYAESPRWDRALEHRLIRAGMPLRSGEFVVLCICSAFPVMLLFFIIAGTPVMAFVGAIAGGALPFLLIRIKTEKRMKLFNKQLGDALILIANSLRTGYSFMQAMDMVSREMKAPIASEFSRTVKEMNLGTTTESALGNMAKRIDSEDLDLVITAMLIQRQVGGNLSEVLDNIARTIRERVRIRGEIKTMTAQGRVSGLIVGLLPIVMGCVIYLLNPEYIRPLFLHPIGRLMLGVAAVSQVIGILIIRRIVDIEI
jgi:tight adherence protein B